MATITQDMRFRLSLIKYADKYGVTKAAVKYKTNRQYIYRWKHRYNGSIESLRDLSRRPHHHPNQHTPEEIKLISDMRRRNPHAGLVVFWVKLMQRGYSRSIPGLYRFLKKQGMMAVHSPNKSSTECTSACGSVSAISSRYATCVLPVRDCMPRPLPPI